MNKKLIILAVALVVVGGAGFALMSSKKKTTPASTATPTTNVTENKDTTKTETTTDTSIPEAQINIKDSAFFKNPLEVKIGTKVTWVNQDSAAHTVSADSDSPAGGPNSDTLENNESYTMTFHSVGTFKYHCKFHSSMTGSVVVIE